METTVCARNRIVPRANNYVIDLTMSDGVR